jgi:archaeosine synthase
MTDHFEIIDRDGPARLGDLRLAESLTTPAIADDVLTDSGSQWVAEQELRDGDEQTLTVLPHRGFPPGTDETVVDAFAPDYPDVEYPSAVVVNEQTASDYGADAYILSTATAAVGHASAFVDAITGVREAIPDDTALVFSGVATPANVALLAYAGVDLVDTHRAVVAGTQQQVLTADGAYDLDDCTEVPGADGPAPAEWTQDDCIEHNVAALRRELATVRERLRNGRLRDYVERSVRAEPWQTAALRTFDGQWSYLEARTPVARERDITATSAETLDRVEIKRFADRVTSRYRNRFDGPLVLVPCSARKPYGESQSHGQFHDAIAYRGHKVSLTSPLGVVPQELETTYPAQHYDTAVSGDWSADEIDVIADVLGRYLDRNAYPRVIAHVPDGGYRRICERALEQTDADIDVEYTVAEHPTTDDSLAALREALDGELKYSRTTRRRNTLRAIADYQFGDGAGDALLADIDIESRYPKLRATTHDGEQLAAQVPQYGLLALTIAGARRWDASDVPTKRVHIDDFTPHGSVLAPGITDADDGIRVGEEVVVEGPSAFGVGRARMPGPAMAESTRGEAVQMRHVEEI